MRRSAGLISTAIDSSTSGYTNTLAKEVCRRALASNGLLRTRRWTPVSVRSWPYACSPLTFRVALLMPATSPPVRSSTSTAKPFLSQYLMYMRSSIAAQSCASVPPEPAWMSTKQLLGSSGLENMRRNSSAATSVSRRDASRPISSSVASSASAREEIGREASRLETDVAALEFRRMFSNPLDPNNCFVDIQAGSGGTEAQDWAAMLERM